MRTGTSIAALLLCQSLLPALHAQSVGCAIEPLAADRRGSAKAISRRGDTLYLGSGAAVIVVDTTDIEVPLEKGYVNLDEMVRDLAHWETTVVALGELGLAFIDAADPEHPEIVGRFPFPSGWQVNAVTAREWRAYVPELAGLHLIDFSDPSSPIEVGFFPAAATRDVALNGDLAYLLTVPAILVLDISDPQAPVQIGTVPVHPDNNDRLSIAGNGSRLAAHGNWTDFVWSGSGAELFTLADPSLPVWKSRLSYDDWFIDEVVFSWDRAYISELVYDVSALANPVYLGSLWPQLWAYDMAMAPDPRYLFVADPRSGFHVADVRAPNAPEIVATLPAPSDAVDGYVAGSVAVLLRQERLETFDVSDPTRPRQLGALDLSDANLQEIERVGNHAYVVAASPESRIEVVDLADPSHPAAVGTAATFVWNEPASSGNVLAYMDGSTAFVRLLDVSQPGAPSILGQVDLDGDSYKTDFTIGPERLYVWDYDGLEAPAKLRIFDISTPAQPDELGAEAMDPWHWGRSRVFGSYLLLADEDRFDVLDVADPASPSRVASLPLPPANWYQRRLTLYGSRAIVAPNRRFREEYDERFFVIDVSNPRSPTVTAGIETPGDARAAVSGPGVLFVADGPAGYSIYSSCMPFADGFEGGDVSEWSLAGR
jgi:hypothetical protein